MINLQIFFNIQIFIYKFYNFFYRLPFMILYNITFIDFLIKIFLMFCLVGNQFFPSYKYSITKSAKLIHMYARMSIQTSTIGKFFIANLTYHIFLFYYYFLMNSLVTFIGKLSAKSFLAH